MGLILTAFLFFRISRVDIGTMRTGFAVKLPSKSKTAVRKFHRFSEIIRRTGQFQRQLLGYPTGWIFDFNNKQNLIGQEFIDEGLDELFLSSVSRTGIPRLSLHHPSRYCSKKYSADQEQSGQNLRFRNGKAP